MSATTRYTATIALTVALGGFLMGFDASVISGVVGFIEIEFALTDLELGWAVASLTLTATLAMMVSGPLADRFGRRPVLKVAAALFLVSALASALAPNYLALVAARMLGGLGVGAALILAPMYIAELAPRELRGRLVSFNQLNIVIGISVAFFSNYLVLRLGQSDTGWVAALNLDRWSWRWMLGIEALPVVVYFCALFAVPESPRWLAMRGRRDDALEILEKANGEAGRIELGNIEKSIESDRKKAVASLRELFAPAIRLSLTIGITVAVLQQITGINAVFFYAPMIFEQTGIGTDASFMQAILVGMVNLVFTVAAILLIDRIGRRPLLGFGTAGVALCMFLLAYSFGSATYELTAASDLPPGIDQSLLRPVMGEVYESDLAFKTALSTALGSPVFSQHESSLLSAAINIDAGLVLIGILGFVASFAISLGPVMWVLFSELFPNRLRGLAISFVGLINSTVSFLVQLVFPWELSALGSAVTFTLYGAFAVLGGFFIMRVLPETRGRSLEELEGLLGASPATGIGVSSRGRNRA